MNIVLAGGTGFIGRALCTALSAQGHSVTLLVRKALSRVAPICGHVTHVLWDGATSGSWEGCVEQADAVVNLAGAPIADRRWTEARKRQLIASRVDATRVLVKAIASRSRRPVTLVNASGIGYYGPSDEMVFDEQSGRGQGFLAELSAAWEAEAMRAESFGARVVRLRIGMVLERDGGALAKMHLPFALGLGGPVQPGTQWISWIHRRDLIRLIEWAIRQPAVVGALNAVAPHSVTMNEFSRALGHALHRPSWLPVPELAVRVGLGEMGSMLTTGQRVVPKKALAQGFTYEYPSIQDALSAVYRSERGVDTIAAS
ncbi:MAG: TIGR01777 family oxidoreductase [Nitrospiraceae bacterium]